MANKKYYKRTVRYTTLVVQASKIEIVETNVKDFGIRVFHVEPNGSLTYIKTVVVEAKKKNDFVYIGAKNIEIKDLVFGEQYALQAIAHKTDGTFSMPTPYVYETAGDNTNPLTFSDPVKDATSTAVTFSITPNNVPNDFEEFHWIVREEACDLNATTPPKDHSVIDQPDNDEVPTFITTDLNNPHISVTKNRTTWFYCWVKALDTSGNPGPDNWFYVGDGKIQAISDTSDIDNVPPYDTNASADTDILPNAIIISQ